MRGIGTAGGFKLIVEDKNKVGYTALEKMAQQLATEASKDPAIGRAFITFSTKTPRIYADIDRTKAEMLGVQDASVFNTLQTYLGSTYINDFTYLGYTYQVRAQADWPFRRDESDILRLKTRSTSGGMTPIGAVNQTRGVLNGRSTPGWVIRK